MNDVLVKVEANDTTLNYGRLNGKRFYVGQFYRLRKAWLNVKKNSLEFVEFPLPDNCEPTDAFRWLLEMEQAGMDWNWELKQISESQLFLDLVEGQEFREPVGIRQLLEPVVENMIRSVDNDLERSLPIEATAPMDSVEDAKRILKALAQPGKADGKTAKDTSGSVVEVLVKERRIVVDGVSFDCDSEKALRWAKVLVERPFEVIPKSELETYDPELTGITTVKNKDCWDYLPREFKDKVETKSGAMGGKRFNPAERD